MARTYVVSSPEPKAHSWTYSVGRHPLSVRRRHPSSVNLFKRHLLWSHEADYFHISHIASIGRGNNNVDFCSNRMRTLVVKASYSFHWLIQPHRFPVITRQRKPEATYCNFANFKWTVDSKTDINQNGIQIIKNLSKIRVWTNHLFLIFRIFTLISKDQK